MISIAAEKVDREIAITEAGIFGEDSILFELKNSGMNLVVIRDLYLVSAQQVAIINTDHF